MNEMKGIPITGINLTDDLSKRWSILIRKERFLNEATKSLMEHLVALEMENNEKLKAEVDVLWAETYKQLGFSESERPDVPLVVDVTDELHATVKPVVMGGWSTMTDGVPDDFQDGRERGETPPETFAPEENAPSDTETCDKWYGPGDCPSCGKPTPWKETKTEEETDKGEGDSAGSR